MQMEVARRGVGHLLIRFRVIPGLVRGRPASPFRWTLLHKPLHRMTRRESVWQRSPREAWPMLVVSASSGACQQDIPGNAGVRMVANHLRSGRNPGLVVRQPAAYTD